MVGGSYSINFTEAEIGGQKFHFGAGGVARGLFQSVTDSQRALRIWDVEDDLFHGYTFGGRISLYAKGKDAKPDEWAPVAYFDVSWGHFQNFETAKPRNDSKRAKDCLADPGKCLADGNPLPNRDVDFIRDLPGRMYAEARIFLKNVYLGFDLNNGDRRDDLRFIGGVTVSLNQFIKRTE